MDVERSCVAVLMFEGRLYAIDGPLTIGALAPAEAVGSVVRDTGCNDTPEPGDPPGAPLRDGDSNFLPAGTTIHAVDGFPVSRRLAVRPDTVWIFLRSDAF